MSKDTKSVLITGASGGIGSAAVRSMETRGWRVFAGVRTLEAGEQLARSHPGVIPVELDVCEEDSVAMAREEVGRQLAGRGLDGLVNNAGCSVDGPVELLTLTALRQQLEVNVIGQITVTQAFLPMLRLAQGRIVNMGGAAGRMTLPMYGALSASKGALDSLTDALRMELKHQGVLVSYIEPGAVETRFFRTSAEAALRDGQAGTPEIQQIYAKAIEASARALADSRTSPVDHVVRAIVKALTSRRPAARYIVGTEAKVGLRVLLRLPVGVRDRVLMSSLGLARKAFDSDAGAESGRVRKA